MQVISLTYNPFQENTYLAVSDDKAILIDPGMSNASEREHFLSMLEAEGLDVSAIWLTHAHIDHVLGLDWAQHHFGLQAIMFEEDVKTFELAEVASKMYGIPYDPAEVPTQFFVEGKREENGEEWEVRWVPGHAPGHVVFVHHASAQVLGGDVLFRESIGRTDLPGGDHETLLKEIKEKLYTLPDHFEVFPGHGPSTTIGYEKQNNAFVRG